MRSLTRRNVPALFTHLAAAMAVERVTIDALNVFPVPDGDTGTNLLLTVQAGRDAVAHIGVLDDVTTTARRALLRGARGNSGVILSQVLAGFVDAMDSGEVTVHRLAAMLGDARNRAYRAVADPVQGTILTALDGAVDAAGRIDGLAGERHLPSVMRAVGEAVDMTVMATQNMLEENRRARVVDAGARGFAVLWWGMVSFVAGDEIAAAPDDQADDDANAGQPVVHADPLGPAYEVMYVLELAEADTRESVVGALRSRFQEIGDSVVVVGDGDLIQAHVHTDDIAAAIGAADGHGQATDVRVTRFADQVGTCAEDTAPAVPLARVGYVAVVPGPGIAGMVADLGATSVHGAAGDLPNVAVLLDAVARTAAETVVLLPGHPNVVPTARQAAAVSVAEGGRDLPVVAEAASVPAVLAALFDAADDELDLDALAAAATSVRAGEVVPAVRDADTAIGPVVAGQWLAVVAGDIVGVHDTRSPALLDVVGAIAEDGELVTLIHGAAVDTDESVAAADQVRERLGAHVEVECFEGGQSPTVWIVGVE